MIDLKLLQKDFDHVSKQLQRKGVTVEIIASIKEKNEALKKLKLHLKLLKRTKMR